MNKKIITNLTIYTVLLFLLFSCSSAPKETDIVNSRKNKAAELTEFGNSYYSEGKYDQALVFFNLALEENIASDNEPGIIKSNNSAGKAYLYTDKLEMAEKSFKKAYEMSLKINDRDLRTVSSNNLGELYIRTGEYKKAEGMLEKAFDSAGTNSEEAAVILHNLGITLKKNKDYSKALSRFNQSAKINNSNKKHANLAANYYMIASIHSKKESYDNAESFLLKALEEDKLVENSYGIGKDFKALAIVMEKKGDTESAYGYFLKSYMVFDVLKIRPEIAAVLKKLKNTASQLERVKDSAYFASELEKYEVQGETE